MRRKMKTIKYGAFQISKNLDNSSIMRRSRVSHKLIDYMNCIGNIRASNNEIDYTPNKLSVESSIR